MNQATLDLYYTLKDYDVGLGYSGIFTDDITDNFIQFCDDLIINQKNDLKTSKVINFLLCESFQNVVRHASIESIDDDTSFEGYFGLHNIGNDYRLNSINKVNTDKNTKANTNANLYACTNAHDNIIVNTNANVNTTSSPIPTATPTPTASPNSNTSCYNKLY